MIVLDTNVVSEPLQPSSSPIVAEWLEAQDSSSCFLTAVTEAELLLGVFRLPDGKRKRKLETGVEQILAMFGKYFRSRRLAPASTRQSLYAAHGSGARSRNLTR